MGTPRTGPEPAYNDQFGVIWKPNQDFVYLSRRFYSYWEDVIAGRDNAFAIDPTGFAVQVTVGFKKDRPAFIKGFEDFGQYYSLKGKSYVKFKYVEPLTFYFRILGEDEREIEYPKQHGTVPEVINLDSDSEPEQLVNEDVAPPNGGGINWDKVVTRRIVEGRDPLFLPAPVVEQLAQSGQTRLTVRVLNTDLVEDCNLRRAKRNKHEAYLTQGWHGLCKALKLSVGDKLFFTFVQNEIQLFVLSMPDEFIIVV